MSETPNPIEQLPALVDQINDLVDNLVTQCNSLDKEAHKDELANLREQIKKVTNKLSNVLPETKAPINLNGDGSKLDKLKARAARFGSTESAELRKATDSEKLSKRKERFKSTEAASTDDAKRRRLERFSGQT